MVSGGYNHALALKSDGTVWAWGDNTNGQLGNGTSVGQQSSPSQVFDGDGEPLTDFVKVVAGGNHSLALRSDGTLWEWGDWVSLNNYQEIIPSPRQIQLPNPVKDMATGGLFCLALLEDGTVWGWGQNNWGQLATGTSEGVETFYNTPVQAVSPYGEGYLTDVVKLVSSDSFAAALTEDGKLYGWGNNYSNPLVLEGSPEIVSVPTLITAFPEPVVDLDAGAYGLGAVLESGKVWATKLPFINTSQVFTAPEVTDAKQVAMGGNSLAALTASGNVWTRGVNGGVDNPSSTFILGNPDVAYQSDQALVKGPNGVGFLTDAIYLSEGNSTAYVIRKDGTLWSWGSNQYGQLGIGVAGDRETTNPSKVPVAVTFDGAPFKLAASADASLKSISLNGEALSGFMPDTKQYEVDIEAGTASVTIGAEPSDTASVVTVNHALVVGDGSATIDLHAGSNVVGIAITAPDGISKESYSVKINVGFGTDFPTKDWDLRLSEANSAMTQSVNLPDGGSIGIQSLPTSDSRIIRSNYKGEKQDPPLNLSNHKTVAVYPLSDSDGNLALVSNVSGGIELVQMTPDLELLTPSTVLVADNANWTGKTALKAKPSSDGGVIIIGKATQTSEWTMPYIVKLDSSWNIVKETGFVVSEDFPDVINDVTEDGAGGYVVTGTLSVGAESPSLLVAHLTSDGDMDDVKPFQRDVYQKGQSIVRTEDNGYLIAGTSASNQSMSNQSGIWLVKLDSSLNLVWDTFTESNGPASVNSLFPLAEGGYAAAGMLDGISGMMVFNKDGYEIWHASDPESTEWLHAIRTMDGGYMTSGSTPDGKAISKKWSGPNLRLSYIQVGFEEKPVPVTVANPQVPDVISFEVEGSSSSVAVVPYLEQTDMKLTVDGAEYVSGDTINVELPYGTISKTIELTVHTPDGRYARSYSVELKAIPVDKNVLKNVIDNVQAFLDTVVTGMEVGQYPVSVIESLHGLLQHAIIVYNAPESSQMAVDEAASQLSQQLYYMPYEQNPYADKVALASSLLQVSQLLKQTVQGTGEGETPSAAFELIQTAYDAAKTVMTNVRAGQEQVDIMVESLRDNIESFQNAVITTYFEDFENDDGGFQTDGDNSSWAYGTPNYSNGPAGAHSGTAIWGTNLTGDYNNDESSYLISSRIDASGNNVQKVVVSAYVWEQTEKNYDYSYIEVSKDGGQYWKILHEFTGGNYSYEGEGEGEGYYPRVPTDWKKLIFELDPSYAVPDLKIRFHLYTDGSETEPGIYVDDVAVYVVKKSLKTALFTANKTLDAVEEGQLPGQYRYGVRSMIQNEYDTALQVNEDPTATEATRETQLNKLQQSLQLAEGLKVRTSLSANVPNGSIVSYGGQKWIMLDHDTGKMISFNDYHWSEGGYQWSEDGSNTFNPNAEGSLAEQLNNSFLNSLENSDWVQEHEWDTRGIDGRIWNETPSVAAKVGLLSANEYLEYGNVYPGGSGILNDLSNVWTLTPATFFDYEIGTNDQGLYQINYDGNLSKTSPRAYNYIRPVIYLRTDLVQATGSGSDEEPFKLKLDTNELQVSRSTALLSEWFRGINPGIDSVTNAVYAEKLSLPFEDATGVAIAWTSDNDAIASDGTVTRSTYTEGDRTVHLTATVSKGATSDTVEFTLVIKANEISDAEIVAGDKSALTLASILGNNEDESNITTDLELPMSGELGSSIAWTSDDDDAIASDGTVKRGLFTEGDQTVHLTATLSKGATSKTVIFTLVVKAEAISDAEIVDGDKTALTLASILRGNVDASNIMTDLELPTSGELGSSIAWSSDNEAIGANGKVKRGSFTDGDQTVHLTSTVSYGATSETVEFTLVVKANEISDTEIVAGDKLALTLASILGNNEDESNITTDLELPMSGELGSSIAWSSDNEAAIESNGTVKRGSFTDGDQTVHLTATVSKGATSETVEFTLVVKAHEISDAEIVAGDKTALTLASILRSNVDASNIMTDLDLPTSGELGSSIAWSSDNEAAIESNGTVKRGSFTQGDQTVHLTATVSKGATSDTVEFTLVIKANEISDAEIVAGDKTALTLTSILGNNEDESNITTDLELPTSGELGSSIAWSSDNEAAIESNGKVKRGSFTDGDQTVHLTATVSKGATSETVEFTLVVKAEAISEAEIVAGDKTALTLGSILGDNLDGSNITTNLVLPTTGTRGSTISWTSNNTAIAADGTVTRVTFTEGDQTVQLTANFSKGTASGSVVFTLVVKAKAISDSEIVAGDKTALTLSSILGNNVDESNIKTNLELPTTGTLGSTITWTSDNAAITSNGTVTRPTATSGKAIVHLTATITSGSTELKAEFTITVLSIGTDPIPNGEPTEVNADEPLIFENGVVIDLQSISVPAGTKVTATSVVNPVLTGTSLLKVGPVVEFSFQGMQTGQLENPVKLQFPIDPGTDLTKVGIFYLNETTGKWEYQRTHIDANGYVSTFVTHFSTYGVFTADQTSSPVANPASGSVLQVGMSIAITTATVGAEIRYTVDGSEPNSASTLYDSANKPTASTGNGLIVKAIVQKDGMIDSNVQTFTYTISTLSSNAKLSGIQVSTDSSFSDLLVVTPDVSTGTTVYAATVSNVIDSVYVNALAEHTGAQVSIMKDGVPVTVSNAVYLNVGVNQIHIGVTAENGFQQEYVLNVNKQGSSNADISSIQYENKPLLQEGNTFMINVGWNVATVDLLVSLSDPNAHMTVTGATYEMNVIHISNLKFGESQNIYPITVTAQDGTVKTYSLQIVRSSEPSKEILDTNHDRIISIEDVSKLVLEQFDVDGNGFDWNDVMYLLRRIEPSFVRMN